MMNVVGPCGVFGEADEVGGRRGVECSPRNWEICAYHTWVVEGSCPASSHDGQLLLHPRGQFVIRLAFKTNQGMGKMTQWG